MTNKVLILGRVEHRRKETNHNGKSVLTYIVSTFRKSHGSERRILTYHTVKCYGGMAAFIDNIVSPHDLIQVEGKIFTRPLFKHHYIDPQQEDNPKDIIGVDYVGWIVADDIMWLGPKQHYVHSKVETEVKWHNFEFNEGLNKEEDRPY